MAENECRSRSAVEGSGKRGQVLKEDVLKALDKTGRQPADGISLPRRGARARAAGDGAARSGSR